MSGRFHADERAETVRRQLHVDRHGGHGVRDPRRRRRPDERGVSPHQRADGRGVQPGVFCVHAGDLLQPAASSTSSACVCSTPRRRLGFILGVALVMLAPHPAGPVPSLFAHPGTTMLFVGFFLFGLSHGLVEGVINPLIATIYSTEKTKKIVACHAWWPAGLIIGGLLALAMTKFVAVPWQAKLLSDRDPGGGLSLDRRIAAISAQRASGIERLDRRDVEGSHAPDVPAAVRVHVGNGSGGDGTGPVVSARHGRARAAAESGRGKRRALSRLHRRADVRPASVGQRRVAPVTAWHPRGQLCARGDRIVLAGPSRWELECAQRADRRDDLRHRQDVSLADHDRHDGGTVPARRPTAALADGRRGDAVRRRGAARDGRPDGRVRPRRCAADGRGARRRSSRWSLEACGSTSERAAAIAPCHISTSST